MVNRVVGFNLGSTQGIAIITILPGNQEMPAGSAFNSSLMHSIVCFKMGSQLRKKYVILLYSKFSDKYIIILKKYRNFSFRDISRSLIVQKVLLWLECEF